MVYSIKSWPVFQCIFQLWHKAALDIVFFSLLANGRKLMAWPGIVFVVVVVVVNNFFSSLFSSETTAPISLKFGMEFPWVKDYHFSSLHVFQPIRKGHMTKNMFFKRVCLSG